MAGPIQQPPATPPGPGRAPALGADGVPTGGGPDPRALGPVAAQIKEAGRYFCSRRWTPANTGSYSARIDPRHIAVTRADANPGALGDADIGIVAAADDYGQHRFAPTTDLPLHRLVYRLVPDAGAVLHARSVTATALSRVAGERILLEQYELLKTVEGFERRGGRLLVPVFNNAGSPDRCAHWIHRYMVSHAPIQAFLIRGYGLFAWGATLTRAVRLVEALEFMLECELQLAKLSLPREQPV